MNKEKQIEEMARLICANYDGEKGLCGDGIECNHDCWAYREATHLYNADYRKQSEGEWIEHSEIGAMNNAWECSVCHWKTVSFTEMKHSKFCPNCGAKMKGGEQG